MVAPFNQIERLEWNFYSSVLLNKITRFGYFNGSKPNNDPVHSIIMFYSYLDTEYAIYYDSNGMEYPWIYKIQYTAHHITDNALGPSGT